MRYSLGYVLNPAQAIIEFDEQEFSIISQNREESYEYHQIFDDNNIIEYKSIVIHAVRDEEKVRFKEVSELYGIKPQEVRFLGNQEDYVFRFDKWLTQAWASRISKVLEKLYDAPSRYMTFYRYDNITKFEWENTNIGKLNLIWSWIEDSERTAINDIRNKDALEIARCVDLSEIVRMLWKKDLVDNTLGIIIGYGWGVSYVLGSLRSIEATYRFFSENFHIEFADTYESMEEYINEWVFVTDDGIVRTGWRLMVINEKGDTKELTDFDITVHYRIKRNDTTSYIVSLIKADSEVKHIEWPMSMNKTKVSEFVSGFWPYHITASDNNLKKIHEMISNTQVPDITVYYKYGRAKYGKDDIIIFKDYVYNATKKLAIPRLTSNPFYFIDGINGIKVEARDWVHIDTMLIDKAPSMGVAVAKKFDSFHAITKTAFKDSSGELILMTACAWLGHSLFKSELPCPMFFTTGITGSGKTTYAKYLCSLFGIEKPLSIEGTTAFPLRISLTLLNELPLFLNEFRTKMPQAQEKTSILKSLFDGTSFERGRKDLTLESHKFTAYAFMEGEELPDSGATRSRSLIWKVKKSGQGKCVPENVLAENRDIMGSFCYSFYQWAKESIYREAITEGYEMFFRPGIERRILTNVVLMYAWSVCFAPDKQDLFARVCNELLDVQLEDFSRNGTIAEIMNILAKYIGSRYPKIYIDGYHVVIPWNDVIDFVERWRITTELKINNYRDHIEASNIELGYYTVDTNRGNDLALANQIMVDGMRIPIEWIDKRFLCNPEIFKLYNHFNSLKK